MPTLHDAMKLISKLSRDDYEKLVDSLLKSTTLSHSVESYLTETRFVNGRVCPHCGSIHVSRNGKTPKGKQRYICKDCKKSFGVSTNSVLSGTTKKFYYWKKFIRLMLQGASLRYSAQECNISKNTAFNWRHKILDALRLKADSVIMNGIIEADETYFSVSYKGNHKHSKTFTMPRKAHKRGNDIHTRGISKEKVCVPCAINRSNLAVSKSSNLGRPTVTDFHKVLDNRIEKGSTLCTDMHASYKKLAKANGLTLVQIKGGRAKKGIYSIQHLNSYHSSMKKFMGKFNGVSSKYLDNYLEWSNLVSHYRGSLMDKLVTFAEDVFSSVFKEKCSDISKRPTFSF